MSKLKAVMAILAFVLLCFMSTVSAIPYHDGNSHHGIGVVHHSGCDLPLVHTFLLL